MVQLVADFGGAANVFMCPMTEVWSVTTLDTLASKNGLEVEKVGLSPIIVTMTFDTLMEFFKNLLL